MLKPPTEDMKRESTPPGDDFQIRCPRLGHQISFSYCRIENKGLPCFKTLDCWHMYFLVEEFLRQELTPEQWKNLFEGPPKTKVLSLVEMIELAKKRKKEES
jgi:hypothetical protein